MKKTPKLRFKEFSGDWETKTLGKLGEFRKTYSFSRNIEGEGSFKHIHYGDIHMNYNGIISTEKFIPSIDIPNDENYELIKTNDIIFADASEDRKDLGKVAVVRSVEGNILSGLHTLCFRPNEELNSEFFLNHSLGRKYLEFMYTRGNGAKVLGISKSNLSEYSFLAPSKEEQEKLANLFSLIDNKIYLQRDKVEALKDYKKGINQKIFSQKLRFKDDNGNKYPEWEEKKLYEVVDVIDGDRGVNYPKESDFFNKEYCLFLNAKNVTKDGFYFVDTKFITKEKDALLKKGKLEREDIILTTRGTVGNIAYFDNYIEYNNIRINSGMVILRATSITPKYLYKFMDSRFFSKQIEQIAFGSAQPQLTVKGINNFKIIVPCYDEQKKISNLLCNLDTKLRKEKEILDSLKEYKKGLLQQMFV